MNETITTTEPNPSASFAMLENLPAQARKDFAEATIERSYLHGERLFSQNAAPDGIFLLRSGRVKLVAGSASGKQLLLHIAVPGEVLGLSSVAGKPHEVTAECLGSCRVSFIPRWEFLELLRQHPHAAIMVALALSTDLYCAYERVRALRSQSKTARRRSPSLPTARMRN
jgi:CRP/FNR family transcriptional regulator